jgi:predicted aspartyl protease
MGLRDKIFLLSCLAIAGCAEKGACGLVHVTDLKLERHREFFYTTVTINGQNAELLLDTGSDTNLLTESAAHRLGLGIRAYQGRVSGVGGERYTEEVRSREVRMGDAHGEDLTPSTVPDEVFEGSSDGLLAMSFLYTFDLDLDFWGGRVGLYKVVGDCPSPGVAMKEPLYAVPISSVPLDRPAETGELPSREISPVIDVSINGTRLRAVIDSGAHRTALFRDSARRAGIVTAEVLRRSMAHGVGPRAVKSDTRISAPVVIGDLTLSHMPVDVVDQRHPEKVDMLLGIDFLTRVHVWVSHSSHTVVMQYPPQATPLTAE